jgi:DNA-binding NtrC family response regulator
VDVRIIAATNRDLDAAVKQGRFREDLFYRLNVIPISLPPLRERKEDIAPLASYFLHRFASETKKSFTEITPEAQQQLLAYDWPGNVRELRNCIGQALILGDGKTIRLADLPPPVRASAGGPAEELLPLADVEKEHIERVLRATEWNKTKSARLLGISKPTLYDKIRNYGLAPD